MLPKLNDYTNVLKMSKMDGGINLNDSISDNQYANLLNMVWENGTLKKRNGYEVFEQFESDIIDCYVKDNIFYGVFLNKMIAYDLNTGKIISETNGMANTKKGSFIERGTTLYYFSGNGVYEVTSKLGKPSLNETTLDRGIFNNGQIAENAFLNSNTNEVHIYNPDTNEWTIQETLLSNKVVNITKQTITSGKADGYYVNSMKINRYGTDTDGNYTKEETEYTGISIYFAYGWSYGLLDDNTFYTTTQNSNGQQTLTIYSLNEDLTVSALSSKIVNNTNANAGKQRKFLGICPFMEGYYIAFDVFKSAALLPNDGYACPVTMYIYDRQLNVIASTVLATLNPNNMSYLSSCPTVSAVDNIFTITNTNQFQTKAMYMLKDGKLKFLQGLQQETRLSKLATGTYVATTHGAITPFSVEKGYIEWGKDLSYDTALWGDVKEFGCWTQALNTATSPYPVAKIIDTTNKIIPIDPYIPTVCTVYSDSDTVFREDLNLLTDEFIVINGSNSVSVTVPFKAEEIEIISPEGGTMTAQGNTTKITFSTAPASIRLRNKTYRNEIGKCIFTTMYGGSSNIGNFGTRVFASGNTEEPTKYYFSDVNNPRYFPESNYDYLDINSQSITGFAKMYDTLIILKENSIFSVNYSFDGETVTFPVTVVSDFIGCEMPNSIQIINNKPTFANKNGIYIIDVTENSSERNVKPLSYNINTEKGYLRHDKTSLYNAVSIDYNGKYMLNIDDLVYIYDYGKGPYYDNGDLFKAQLRLPFYIWDNIEAIKFFLIKGNLAFVKGSKIYVFNKDCFKDSEKAIKAVVKTKSIDFNDPSAFKNIYEIWANIPKGKELNLKCIDELDTCDLGILKKHSPVLSLRLRHRRIRNISFEFTHTKNEEFEFNGLDIQYMVTKVRK